MKALPQFISSDNSLYTDWAYLTTAATCSQGASLELLLSSAALHNLYKGVTTSNISCPLGPCVPAVMTCLGCPSPSSTRFTPSLLPTPTQTPQVSIPALT